jgi:hypothetical protein
MVAERDPRGRADGPDAKRLEVGSAMLLLRDSGQRSAMRTRLSEIYNWSTEGIDTADLKDAEALLIELSDSP